ncbi:MAG: hypothetical protein P8130_08065, partial [Deltaproteobacteria bacterium]
MIVRMAKVEIFGPRPLLMQTLASVRQLGFLHLEMEPSAHIHPAMAVRLRSLALDAKTLSQRLFYEDLHQKIVALINRLPKIPTRPVYLSPLAALKPISSLIDRHNARGQQLAQRHEALAAEQRELIRYDAFLQAVAPLLGSMRKDSNLDFLAIEIKDPQVLDRLTGTINRLTHGAYEMQTAEQPDGKVVGLIATEKKMLDSLKDGLAEENIPEFSSGEDELKKLPFREK